MKHALLASAVLATLFVSPSVLASSKKQAELDARERASAQSMVDAKMTETMQSIDQSLNVLVGLTRGGEPPRVAPAAYGNTQPNALAPTVAGNARLVDQDARVQVAPAILPPHTATEIERAAAKEKALNEALNRRVDVSWNGYAHDLLAKLSEQIDYNFAQGRTAVGTSKEAPIKVHVKVSADNATVRDVLQKVANQVEGKADVFVSVPQRSISLLRK